MNKVLHGLILLEVYSTAQPTIHFTSFQTAVSLFTLPLKAIFVDFSIKSAMYTPYYISKNLQSHESVKFEP